MKSRLATICVLILLCSGVFSSGAWSATTDIRMSKGQTVYVPAYSNVFTGPKKNPFQLALMLSIRNVDPSASIRITAMDYYDNVGKLIRRSPAVPVMLGPLASHHVYLEENDTAGGFGANFIVRWKSDTTVNAPIVECLMIGTKSGQGISFVSSGQEIRE